MIELNQQQMQQMINAEQLYTAFITTRRDYNARFAGSLAWKTVSGKRYLYRKKAKVWQSLGPETDETHHIFEQFEQGRQESKIRLKSLQDRIDAMAPVNRALRLGRVPRIAARMVRQIEDVGALGHGIRIVGTNALYAYESLAAVQFEPDYLATMDMDLLYDARRTLKLATTAFGHEGLLSLLRRVDRSLEKVGQRSFRAANNDGYIIDVVTPTKRHNATRTPPHLPGNHLDDLTPVEIDGLAWLENCPSVERVVLDEHGFPLTLVAPDPRVFAMHKIWLSQRVDRDAAKRRRDAGQAREVAIMMKRYLPHMSFDDPALSAVPLALRNAAMELARAT